MSLKAIRIAIVLLSLLALTIPSPAKSAAAEVSSDAIATPFADAFVSIESNPTGLHAGESALLSVKLNNVPAEGIKSAEFTCIYNPGLLEKSNITITDLFGADPVSAIHDPQNGIFIVAVAGANSSRAMISGPAFTFSVKALQIGQSSILCTARVSQGDNVPIDLPGVAMDLTVLGADVSPTPLIVPTATSEVHESPSATSMPAESPTSTALPSGVLSGQIVASKPVNVRLLDANRVELTSLIANPDGTFAMTLIPGDYTFVATASGFLSYEGSVTIVGGAPTEFPAVSLLAGDVDGNNVIDPFDALTIGMNYTSSTPEAADLNNDAVIDFLDLELLAENYRQTGPITGTVSASMMGLLQRKGSTPTVSPIPGLTKTVIAPGVTSSPDPYVTKTMIAPVVTLSPMPVPNDTRSTPTQSTGTTGPGAPFADAPLCPTHDPTKWHGLWDGERGCHYDHEHGSSPFTAEVAATFPNFDLRALLCGVEIGHCVPSGPTEHSHKHGGFKWNVQLRHPEGCTGFEGAPTGVDGSVIQVHGFGNYAIELEASVHSVVALLRQCSPGNPNDYGYVFVSQHVSYGQVISPYQGDLLSYPYYTVPPYDTPRGPYLSVDCIGQKLPGQTGDCRDDLAQARRFDANSNWASKPTGQGQRPASSSLLQVLWRLRDSYQMFDWNDQSYPYSFLWLCSADGLSYVQAGCKYNNSTTQVHEVQGTIPASWDNLAGFDTDPRVGRITAQGYVTRFGDLNTSCTTAGTDCHPIKMVQAFVGQYGSVLVFTPNKGPNIVPYLPERDIYFCGGVPCTETSAGAVPSGWIGAEN